ncbi:MAG: hypothetical protein LBE38_00190 [Deltaproteobacteria bacterium]|jgi:nucleoside phosphorylase|nr:hypothetical protein [Deltaproteobacteria bacterium]
MAFGSKAEIILLAPTPGEYLGLTSHLKQKTFNHLKVTIVETGPGKINAALKLSLELTARDLDGKRPAFVAGVGTCGSLDKTLVRGNVVSSKDCIICDWRHEDGKEILVGPYGVFDYGEATEKRVKSMAITSDSKLIGELIEELGKNAFKVGRVLTADSFVSGAKLKLSLGKIFSALVCDMESGAFAYTSKRFNELPWFNLRVVADTLDESLADYFKMEKTVTDILGERTVEALGFLDRLLE